MQRLAPYKATSHHPYHTTHHTSHHSSHLTSLTLRTSSPGPNHSHHPRTPELRNSLQNNVVSHQCSQNGQEESSRGHVRNDLRQTRHQDRYGDGYHLTREMLKEYELFSYPVTQSRYLHEYIISPLTCAPLAMVNPDPSTH